MNKTLVVLLSCITMIAAYFAYLSDASQDRADNAAYVPVITVMDILHATDLQSGIKQAVKQSNSDKIDEWVSQALVVAEEAKLPTADITYLQSDAARDYLVFNAKRQLFNDAFEEQYYTLGGIDELKVKYPEAQDLFERAQTLLDKREQIIYQIAMTVSGNQTPTQQDVQNAQEIWVDKNNNARQQAPSS